MKSPKSVDVNSIYSRFANSSFAEGESTMDWAEFEWQRIHEKSLRERKKYFDFVYGDLDAIQKEARELRDKTRSDHIQDILTQKTALDNVLAEKARQAISGAKLKSILVESKVSHADTLLKIQRIAESYAEAKYNLTSYFINEAAKKPSSSSDLFNELQEHLVTLKEIMDEFRTEPEDSPELEEREVDDIPIDELVVDWSDTLVADKSTLEIMDKPQFEVVEYPSIHYVANTYKDVSKSAQDEIEHKRERREVEDANQAAHDKNRLRYNRDFRKNDTQENHEFEPRRNRNFLNDASMVMSAIVLGIAVWLWCSELSMFKRIVLNVFSFSEIESWIMMGFVLGMGLAIEVITKKPTKKWFCSQAFKSSTKYYWFLVILVAVIGLNALSIGQNALKMTEYNELLDRELALTGRVQMLETSMEDSEESGNEREAENQLDDVHAQLKEVQEKIKNHYSGFDRLTRFFVVSLFSLLNLTVGAILWNIGMLMLTAARLKQSIENMEKLKTRLEAIFYGIQRTMNSMIGSEITIIRLNGAREWYEVRISEEYHLKC